MGSELIATITGIGLTAFIGFVVWLTKVAYDVGWIRSSLETRLDYHGVEINQLGERVTKVEATTTNNQIEIELLKDER